MKKKAIIILSAVLLAAPAHKMPEPLSVRTVAYEINENKGMERGIDEAAETETQTELNGDIETSLAEETEEETEVFPEPSDFKYEEEEEPHSLLSSNEAVVRNYQELKNALEGDNGITSVYFGDNITMQAGGVDINPNKSHVVVSGLNPLDPGRTEPYILTDYSSSSFYNTIYIDAAGVNSLTIRDMNITGKNFYGPFSVYDSSALDGVSVIYERVNYNGPQLGYHRKGTIQIKDCTVRIHGGNGGSLNQEFSEAKNLIFEGSNIIHSDSSANTVFWHPAGGSFTLTDHSSLVLTSPNTSALYGVFYADLSIYKVNIIIGERACLEMTISGVVAPDAFVTLSGLTVRESGELNLETTKTTDGAVLRIGGELMVEKEARVVISGYGGSGASSSLLKQETGDITIMKDAVFHLKSQNAYSSLINLVGRAFSCNDPSSVLLYNTNRDILATTGSSRIYVNAQQVNFWDKTHAGGLDAPESNRWYKPDGTNFIIDGTISTGTGGDFTAISSNYEQGDPPGSAPDASNFSIKNARVLAFGRLELTAYQPSIKSTAVSGATKPGAAVRIWFSQNGEDYILPDTTTDSMGVFHAPLDTALEEGTVISIKIGWQYLTASTEAVVRDGGALEFIVPESMEFFITGISSSEKIIERLHSGWEIIVSDGRGIGGAWSLYARLGAEMSPNREGLPALNGALVYVDSSGSEKVMSVDADVLIAWHRSSSGEEVFPVSWDEDKGVLLFVKPGTAFTDTVYRASIIWTLIDAP